MAATHEETFLALLQEFRLDYELRYWLGDNPEETHEHHYILSTGDILKQTNIAGFLNHHMAYSFNKYGAFAGAWIDHNPPGERRERSEKISL